MDKIKELYEDPKIGLTGLETFRKKLRDRGIEISKEKLTEILSGVNAFSIHRKVKKTFPRRKIIVQRPFEQLQADLAEVNKMDPQHNNNTRYLLTVVDVMSKYAWVIPLKDKKATTVLEALKPIILESHPEKLQTDKGSEFFNSTVQKFLKSENVKLFATESDQKASVVERFNRTLKNILFRYMDAKKTDRYIDILQDVVDNYNNTKHSTIGVTPVEALEPENTFKVYANYYKKEFKRKKSSNNLKMGDIVRLSAAKRVFDKESLNGNWTIELFRITKVNETNPITYGIEDLQGEEVMGAYYDSELQKVPKSLLDEPAEIEKVIRTRTYKGKKQSFVKYRGYPDKFNAWVDSSELEQDLN